MQVIGIVAIAVVTTATINVIVVVDPFTLQLTLAINGLATAYCGGRNVTITPGGISCTSEPCQSTFKSGTEVTITIYIVPGTGMVIGAWKGVDASNEVKITAGQTYKITRTKDMDITVN